MSEHENNVPGSSGVKIITREYIFRMASDCIKTEFAKKLDTVGYQLTNSSTFPKEHKTGFLRKFSRLKSEFKNRWHAANRIEPLFLKKNDEWLKGTLEIPLTRNTTACTSSAAGRPQKDFDTLSDRSKRRKTESLLLNHEAPQLLYASQMKLRESGNFSGARVVKDIVTSPKRGEKYQKPLKKSDTPVSKSQLSSTQALSIYVEASLTRKQYEIIRTSDKKLYPCYTILQKAKKDCYPVQEAYSVTETSAEVNLQDLLNHTVERLLLYLDEVLLTLSANELAALDLVVKWGCDGSHQAQFKQKFENSDQSDAYIFQSSMVPVQLICRLNNKVIWHNGTPSSSRFCRPMRIRFVHETSDVTNEEISYFTDKITNLEATKLIKGDKEIIVKHIMLFTMVDGKVCNAATQTKSTRRCYICKLTSKDFNKLEKPQESVIENLQFGLSILHARIRFFETLLHLSYMLPIKKYQQTLTKQEKELVQTRKLNIQKQFRDQLGLIVDVPKQGFGTSNDGNTSRRFFTNAEISSSITDIDLNLIKRFAVVLEVISCGQNIDLTKFESYCDDTAKLYVELYGWKPMTPTVHKVLIHGPIVMKHALLPIGNLSEEAAEARNKHFREYRNSFSRKFSREQCNLDVLNRLLLTSDPFLSSIRPKPPKNVKTFSSEARDMMLPPEMHVNEIGDTARPQTLNISSSSDDNESSGDDVSDVST